MKNGRHPEKQMKRSSSLSFGPTVPVQKAVGQPVLWHMETYVLPWKRNLE